VGKKNRLVPDCKGCTKANEITCKVIKDPGGVWKNGSCFAWSDNPYWERETEEAVKKYKKEASGL